MPPHREITLLATILLLASPALAQSGKPPGGTGTTGTSTPGTTQPPRQTIPPVRDDRRPSRPIFLSGRVIVDDGSPLTERAAIERVCDGRALREAYTDSEGYFSFEVGQANRMFQDASTDASPGGFGMGRGGAAPGTPGWVSTESGISERDLQGCELRANLSGFRSDSLRLAGRTLSDPSVNVGAIVLHRLGKVDGRAISVTTMQAPKAAKKALERAEKALTKQKPQEAEQQLQEAVRLYPQYAQAWVELGALYWKANRNVEAEAAFERALQADDKFLPSYVHLAALAGLNQQWQRMADVTDKALALDAYDYPGLYFYNSVAYYNLRKLDQAEKSARSARRLDSQHQIPRIDLLLSQILERRQDYNGAADELRSFLKYAPNDSQAEQARSQLADIERKLPPKNPQ